MLICAACAAESQDDARFCHACGAALGAPAAPREIRKVVTALSCDLVGSTELAETHDPEVLRPVLDRYFTEMRSTVEGHGGRVQKFIGDAVVAIFGLPASHEDDGLRAVRAGLEMQRRMRGFPGAPIRLEARIGICTGEVLVPGDDDGVIVGDAMNTASRLQTAAAPGDVLIGMSTWHLVRSAVEAEALEPFLVHGKAEPVAAWRVVTVDETRERSETPFVGRDRPMRTLDDALADAVDGRASVLVTVLAPPGVGKSRLASAFAAKAADRATVLVGQTPSYGEGVTFAPLVELLSQAAGQPSGEAEDVAAALRERVAAEPDGPSLGDRLAQFLGVGEARGADTPWAVRRLLEVLARDRPVVVVLEDLHWAEPPMLDLVDAVVERVRGPVVFVCLARPELLEQRPGWAAGNPRSTTTTLPPLSEADAWRIASHLLGVNVPRSVIDRVCATAEGNPLYLEQLTAMLADQGLLVAGEWVGPADAEVDIPDTLRALLAARLDRLDPSSRSVLECAAVEGRRFRIAAVRAMGEERDPGDVEAAIAVLDRDGLALPEDEAKGRWRFVHALVLEAAYRGISKVRRAELHERLAEWMRTADADLADADESVARHLERALYLREELGERDERSGALALRAGELFAAAGSRAFAAVDLITSRDLLGRAAALLPEDDPRRLDLLPNLGVALSETGRPEETEALLTEVVEKDRGVVGERAVLRASIQLLSNRVYRSPTDAEIEAAITQAEAAVGELEALDDEAGLAEAAIALEYLEYMRGRLARAHVWTFRALRHGLAAGRLRESAQGAADIVGFAQMGPLPFDRFPATAEERLFPFGEPISSSAGHAVLAIGALAVGDETGFLEHEARWRDVVDRHGLTWLGAAQSLQLAWAEVGVGRPDAAERRLREARDVLVALGDIWWVSSLDQILCSAVAAQDESQRFLRLADAFEASAWIPDRETLIQRSLIRSRALLLRGAPADAEVAARRGIELAGTTDLVLDHVSALLLLAEILEVRGLADDAVAARADAIARLRAKGALVQVALLSVDV